MTTRGSDHQYDLEVKGQGQIYLKSILWPVTRTELLHVISMFDSWHAVHDVQITQKGSHHRYDL